MLGFYPYFLWKEIILIDTRIIIVEKFIFNFISVLKCILTTLAFVLKGNQNFYERHYKLLNYNIYPNIPNIPPDFNFFSACAMRSWAFFSWSTISCWIYLTHFSNAKIIVYWEIQITKHTTHAQMKYPFPLLKDSNSVDIIIK